jgi:hypothetical protein
MDLGQQSTSFWGWLGGGGLATVIMAALQLRRRLSRDNVDRHSNQAEKSLIDRLSEELDKADRRVEVAEGRADLMFEQRMAMLRELSPIQSTLAAMEERLKQQAEIIAGQKSEIGRLNAELTRQRRTSAGRGNAV